MGQTFFKNGLQEVKFVNQQNVNIFKSFRIGGSLGGGRVFSFKIFVLELKAANKKHNSFVI